MRVLLLRPPRYVWPYNSERSAFWPPLGLLCLAAAARRALPHLEIAVWDAPGQRWGWRTLAARLAATPIAVLGIGEETASAHEGLRAARIVKRLHPGCVVVAGGTHFSHAIPETLASGCVDVIVRGEGETTFVELLRAIDCRDSWRSIRGLAFRDEDQAIITPARDLIQDLDTLPWPAYDLVDLRQYGRGSRNHPALVSLEHSRGCVDSCAFCILWKQMGESVDGDGLVRPRYRSKSAARSFDEVSWLYRRCGRRTFGWVDPTFNASAQWSDEWAERMLRSPLVSARGVARTLHTAWMRADCVVRDEKLGILSKLVRAGLRQVVIGLERDDPAGLALLGKHRNDPEICREALAILREKHPQVYTIGSVIVGLPGDTLADLKRLGTWQDRLRPDHCFLIPLTPLPGTPIAAEVQHAGRLADVCMADYNFHTPICTTDALDLAGVESVYWRAMLRLGRRRVGCAFGGLLLEPDPRKRRVNWALFGHATRVACESLWRTLSGAARARPAAYGRKPRWYDT